MLLRPKMNSVTKSRTHQDTERSGSLAWEKWKLTWVTLVQLGVSGKSGIHPYRNSEHRNKEQSLMEECKYQALTVDLTHKSSWTWTIAFVSFRFESRSTWTMCCPNHHIKSNERSCHILLGQPLSIFFTIYGYKGRMPHSTFGQYFWLFINFFKIKIIWTIISSHHLTSTTTHSTYWPV